MMYLQLVGGLLLLSFTADVMIRGSVALARYFGMSPMMVGMTVIALGTSAPELVVALDAALNGSPAVATGNVVGSNIANVLLIVGAAALVTPIARRPVGKKRDGLLLVAFSGLFLAVGWTGEIGFTSGMALVAVFVVYMGATIHSELSGTAVVDVLAEQSLEAAGGELDNDALVPPESPWPAVFKTIFGLVGIAFAADLMVTGGVEIARTFGVSEEVIGLTLIAIGTSLPELAASVAAARKGHPDVALGNILGSNMFNMLAIAGVTAMVVPLPVSAPMLAFDMLVLLASAVIIAPILMGQLSVPRMTGAAFLLLYAAYLAAQGFGLPERLAG